MSVAGAEDLETDDYEGLKKCKQCGEEKPLSDFYDHWSTVDKKNTHCKKCMNANRKAQYAQRNKLTDVEVSQLDRVQKFVKGFLDTKELTDEELNGRYIQNDNGQRVPFAHLENRPGNRVVAKLNKELSTRLNEYIKSKSLRSVQVIFEIADSELVEPADRLKAATWLAERVIGKTPEVLLTADASKAYEDIFETKVFTGSREDYRLAIESGRDEAIQEVRDVNQRKEIEGLDSESEFQSRLQGNDSLQGGRQNDKNEIIDAEVDDGLHSENYEDVQDKYTGHKNGNGVVLSEGENHGQTSTHGDFGSGGNNLSDSLSSFNGRIQENIRPEEIQFRDGYVQSEINDSGSSVTSAENGQDSGFAHNGQRRTEHRDEKERLRKARAKAKQRRFAARAIGATSLERLPYLPEYSLIKTGAMAGKLKCRLVCPSDMTEGRFAKLQSINALTDDALRILYPENYNSFGDLLEEEEVNSSLDGDLNEKNLDGDSQEKETENGEEHNG